ncbi:rare lipoprotein A [Fodinibius salinus]|uniref:Rare lipoprotein A n=1 Tax=Fodinibius salinus TaxID=860790 RepID=A0A5D3YJB5_9BACT|nr:LysM peptidoglycan-binding domain-containing protein [Fodinibius salinus]TYP93934.1 rare lipoprotein A [Fodinibius salinus]
MSYQKILITIFCIGFLTVGASSCVLAQGTSHTVQEGETLFSIAQQYDVTVQQVKGWNSLTNNNLSVGQELIIRDNTPTDKNQLTHTVKANETLFSISKSYNVSIAEIKSWNNLSSNQLAVGQKLTIYPAEKKSSNESSIVVDEPSDQNTYYTVKNGDTLYRIAQQHRMTVEELKKLNNLASNTIRVGQELTVRDTGTDVPPSVAEAVGSAPQGKFISYEISNSSEGLQDILDKFNMDKQEFKALNTGTNINSLRSGQTVTVLAPPTKVHKNPFLDRLSLQNLGSASVTKYDTTAKAHPTTNGELYNPDALTAAHSNMALGSVVFIRNPANGIGIFVRINDRTSGNALKLSDAAWESLDLSSSSPQITIYQQ